MRVHGKPLQMAQRVRHQPFAARVVDYTPTAFGDNNFQSGPSGVNCRGQTGRAAADDEQVDHLSPASAAFSTRTRVLSNHALSVVNASAVIHALCTNGKATPSAITAT